MALRSDREPNWEPYARTIRARILLIPIDADVARAQSAPPDHSSDDAGRMVANYGSEGWVRSGLYAKTQIPAPTTTATAPTTMAAKACLPLRSVPARRRPSSPNVRPSPPKMIGALSQKANTPKRPWMAQTRPTFAGRLLAALEPQAQPPRTAKSAIVMTMINGTRIMPSRSPGQMCQSGRPSFLTASR
jgi:hypothetical protein